MLWEGKLEQAGSNSAEHWSTVGHKDMLSCLAKLVPCRDIVICPETHSELQIGIRSSLDNCWSHLLLIGFLPALPGGRAALYWTKTNGPFGKHCDFCKTAFVVCTGRWGAVSVGRQQCLCQVLGKFLTDWGGGVKTGQSRAWHGQPGITWLAKVFWCVSSRDGFVCTRRWMGF